MQLNIALEQRKGPAVWSYRWREPGPDGKPVRHRIIVGSVEQFPTAQRETFERERGELPGGAVEQKYEQRHEMLQLAKEETDRAEAIKRQIRLLQDHL